MLVSYVEKSGFTSFNLLDCTFTCPLLFWEVDTWKECDETSEPCSTHLHGLFSFIGWWKMLPWDEVPLAHSPWLVLPLPMTSCTTTWARHNRRSFLKWLPMPRGICMETSYRERMGISIPAQSSTHQLHGLAHRKPGSDESRCVQPRNALSWASVQLPHCRQTFL